MANKPTLNTIFRAIGRLEGKVDGVNDRLDGMNGSIKDHSKRINRVETDVDTMKGKSVAYGTLAGFFTTVIVLLAKVFLFKDK